MFKKKIILGSGSPRRKELIQNLKIPFEVKTQPVDEVFPVDLACEDVAEYLANLKAQPLKSLLKENEVLLTADTVVIQNNKVLGKPKDEAEALEMIKNLSNSEHQVITGVNMTSLDKSISFSSSTKVVFKELSDEEMMFYVKEFKPFDKAGAYGIQEWIGQIGISKIEGCFYNVMGLPVSMVWEKLKKF